jgi:flagellar motor switch protein FliN
VPDDEGLLAQSEIEALFNTLQKGDDASKSNSGSASSPPKAPSASDKIADVGIAPFKLSEIGGPNASVDDPTDVSLILDVDLNVRVELGRTKMYIEDVLRLREGAVVPLDKLAGDPVDIYVNGRLMARGEVLVLNDNFCVRVSEIFGDPKDSPVPHD